LRNFELVWILKLFFFFFYKKSRFEAIAVEDSKAAALTSLLDCKIIFSTYLGIPIKTSPENRIQLKESYYKESLKRN